MYNHHKIVSLEVTKFPDCYLQNSQYLFYAFIYIIRPGNVVVSKNTTKLMIKL